MHAVFENHPLLRKFGGALNLSIKHNRSLYHTSCQLWLHTHHLSRFYITLRKILVLLAWVLYESQDYQQVSLQVISRRRFGSKVNEALQA